jgi:hypothetical protein
LRRHQVDERVVAGRHGPMHGRQQALVLLWPGDRQHFGILRRDLLGLGTQATGHDDLAVLGHGFADCRERLLLRAVEEAAGIDDYDVGILVLADQGITFRPQPGNDPLGIDQRLRTAERHEAHGGAAVRPAPAGGRSIGSANSSQQAGRWHGDAQQCRRGSRTRSKAGRPLPTPVPQAR